MLLATVAVVALLSTARRWRRAGAARDANPQPAIAAEDAQRLERDMASYDL